MKLIVFAILMDALLFTGVWLCGSPLRINLLIFLAFLNLFFFLYLLIRTLIHAERNERPKSIPLEFVMCNTFLLASIGLFRLVCEILYKMGA